MDDRGSLIGVAKTLVLLPGINLMGDKMNVLYGITALEYYETVPLIRDADIPEKVATLNPPEGCGLPAGLLRRRCNANGASQHVVGRLLGDLKGISLPARIMSDDVRGSWSTALARVVPLHKGLQDEDLFSLGGGLYVTSIERTLLDCSREMNSIELLMLMFEACGMYAVPVRNKRTGYVLRRLLDDRVLTPQYPSGSLPKIYSFYDAAGHRALPVGYDLEEYPWELCFSLSGAPTTLWRRPPLTTCRRLLRCRDRHEGVPGIKRFSRLVEHVVDGSASPLETKLVIMLCGSAWLGGEGLPRPWLNRKVDFPHDVQGLAGQTYAIPDILFNDIGLVVECQGKQFHADSLGFEVRNNRRAGLEALGYGVREITYGQMRDLNAWDIMLEGFASRFDITLKKRTPAFLRRRERLHEALR